MSSLGVSYAYLHQLRKQCMEKMKRDKFEACVMAEKGFKENDCTRPTSSLVSQERNKKALGMSLITTGKEQEGIVIHAVMNEHACSPVFSLPEFNHLNLFEGKWECYSSNLSPTRWQKAIDFV